MHGTWALAWVLHRRLPAPPRGGLLPVLGRPAAGLLAVGVAAVGFAALGLRVSARADLTALRSGPVTRLDGSVADDPEAAGRGIRFTLRVREADAARVRARVAVRAFGSHGRLRLGDRVTVRAVVSPLDDDDPFDVRLRRRWVDGRATVQPGGILRRGPSPNPVLRGAERFRSGLRVAARRTLPRADAGLLLGLAIGDEEGIPEPVRDDFRTAGLSHLTAVSGANVAVVVGAVVALLAAARLPKAQQVGGAVAALVLFAVVTRWEPSVLRASVMALLVLGAYGFGRRADPLHGLGVAMTGLLAADPYLLWSPGFQLSCAATAGILVLAARCAAGLGRWTRPVAQAAAVAVAAQIAVLPLVVAHFGRVPLVGVPANLLVVPLVAPAMVLGLAGGAVALVSGAAALPVVRVAGIPTAGLRLVAGWAAGVPHASVGVTLPLLAAAAAAAVLAVFLVRWYRRRDTGCPAGPGDRRRMVLPAVAALAAGIASLLWWRPPATPPGLRVTVFDVGQGEAALVESPDGFRMLVDGGPDPDAVAIRLARRGVRRLDLVVSTHDHADHAGGLPAVLRRMAVRAALAPLPDPRAGRSLPPARRPRQALQGDRIVAGQVVVDVLGPPARLLEAAGAPSPGGEGEGSQLNNGSLVLRVAWGRGCMLFTGDIEEEAQQALLDAGPAALDCPVLKAPHHGSARLLPAFVEAVDPEWVTISSGRNMDFSTFFCRLEA